LGRLKETLQSTNPEVPLMAWNETLPPRARDFNDSMYGFKPHCVQAARDAGYKKIFFIDCTCVIQDKLDYYDQFLPEYGVLAVQDDNKLTGFCSDRVLKYLRKERVWLRNKHLVGGSFYYFDFDNPLCVQIFDWWMAMERGGLFGSMQEQCSERLQGHRSDETMMAISLYIHGSKPFTGATRYNCDNAVIQKMHFK
jgi:hypothetical protein